MKTRKLDSLRYIFTEEGVMVFDYVRRFAFIGFLVALFVFGWGVKLTQAQQNDEERQIFAEEFLKSRPQSTSGVCICSTIC